MRSHTDRLDLVQLYAAVAFRANSIGRWKTTFLVVIFTAPFFRVVELQNSLSIRVLGHVPW